MEPIADPGQAGRALGGGAGILGLGVLAGVAAGATGGAVVGSVVFPVGTLIGMLAGGAVALVPGALIAVVAGVVAGAVLTDARSGPRLGAILAAVGGFGAALLAGPVGWAVLDAGGWWVTAGIWMTIPAEALYLWLAGKAVGGRSSPAPVGFDHGPPGWAPPWPQPPGPSSHSAGPPSPPPPPHPPR